MIDAVKVPTQAEHKKAVEELRQMSQSKDADWKAVAKKAAEVAKMGELIEKAEKDAILKALETKTEDIRKIILGALQPAYDAGELDGADGVWFNWDFGEKLTTCRLTKSAPRKAGGGGGGKKFDVTTEQLLEKFGNEEYKDGVSFSEAYKSAEGDKNARFTVRKALLKKGGYS